MKKIFWMITLVLAMVIGVQAAEGDVYKLGSTGIFEYQENYNNSDTSGFVVWDNFNSNGPGKSGRIGGKLAADVIVKIVNSDLPSEYLTFLTGEHVLVYAKVVQEGTGEVSGYVVQELDIYLLNDPVWTKYYKEKYTNE